MQGMFLLLGIGLIMAASALLSECFKGYQCWDDVKSIRSRRTPIPSIVLTPCGDEFDPNTTFARRASDFCVRAISAGSARIEERVRDSLRRFSH